MGTTTLSRDDRWWAVPVKRGDRAQFGSLRGRFAEKVWPGDTIITKQWFDGDGAAIVQAETDRGVTVLSQGQAGVRAAS